MILIDHVVARIDVVMAKDMIDHLGGVSVGRDMLFGAVGVLCCKSGM